MSKKLVHLERKSLPNKTTVGIGDWSGGRRRGAVDNYYIGSTRPPIFAVQEGKPTIIETEELQYAYKCKHCGHEWSEKHVEEHKEG